MAQKCIVLIMNGSALIGRIMLVNNVGNLINR